MYKGFCGLRATKLDFNQFVVFGDESEGPISSSVYDSPNPPSGETISLL